MLESLGTGHQQGLVLGLREGVSPCVYMYVRTYVYIHDVCILCMYACMHACMYGYMYVCMHVCR